MPITPNRANAMSLSIAKDSRLVIASLYWSASISLCDDSQ